MRYTSRDMEIIRRQARIQAEGNKGELDEMRSVIKNYEDVFAHMKETFSAKEETLNRELRNASTDRDALEGDIKSMDQVF